MSAAALIGGLTACSEVQEVSNTLDKAQACLEATKVVGEVSSKFAGLAQNPEELGKALDEGAAKLEETAAKAGDTTLQEALQGLADAYQKLDVSDVNSAIDSAQQAATDTAKYLSDIQAACS
ncbi:hypothetical protein GCM10023259_085910 [Thermocatellispora tengchongensis]